MSEIRADLRNTTFVPQPEAIAAADVLCDRLKEDQIALAKVLEVIDRSAAFLGERCASIGEFVLRRGLSPFQGRALRFVGRAMLAFPWVESRLRDGSIGFDQAESLGQVCSYEGAIAADDEWETWARFLPLRRLRGRVRRRIEQVRQGTQKLVSFQTHLTHEAFADYERARTLASRKAKRALTRGETIAAVLRAFNRRHDPEERKQGKRRIGDTSDPACRTVPAEVVHACIAAYGDRCWVPGCTNEMFLENMHHKPKRAGGSQEQDNIDRGCHSHHVMYDAGTMWVIGENEQGLPVFETDQGMILHPDFPGRPLQKSSVQPETAERPESAAPPQNCRRAPARPAQDPPAQDRDNDAPSDRVAETRMVWNGTRIPGNDGWLSTAASPRFPAPPRDSRRTAPQALRRTVRSRKGGPPP